MRELVEQALAAMGGRARLESIRGLHLKGFGHYFLIEQSERPEGPWIPRHEQVEEWRDLAGARRHSSTTERPGEVDRSEAIHAEGLRSVRTVVNGREFPARTLPDDGGWLDLSPERVLLTALAAPDLRADGATRYQGVPHRAVAFTWKGAPARILFNADTALPTAVELVRAEPRDTFWNIWGDVTTRWIYSSWYLEHGGLHYPRQADIEKGGYPYRSFSIAEMTINPELPAGRFDLPAPAAELVKNLPPEVDAWPLGRPDRQAAELAPGLLKVPGNWDVALVQQEDGLVIIETPISSAYSRNVLDEARRRFSNVPIKAVITTSDAWPHLGGAREYVAAGIPLYVLDRNEPIIRRLLAAPRTLRPDSLAERRREAELHVVSERTVLGRGANRMEIYPIRTETGERMLMIWFPQHGLLYTSDLVQGPMPDGRFFMPQYLSEIRDAAARERLRPERIFGMHAAHTPWAKVLAAIQAV